MSNIPGIQEYYNQKNVFITGGTGFLGKVCFLCIFYLTLLPLVFKLLTILKFKNIINFTQQVLIEKLLRSCTGINKIYLLIRSKKGVSSNQRLQNLLHSKIFSIELKFNEIENKIVAIEGDLTKEGMGLSVRSEKLVF